MASLLRLSAPALEPVSLPEIKTHLRIDGSAEDTMLGGLIVAAREWAENYTRRSFIGQNWQLTLNADEFGASTLSLPRAPVLALQSFSVADGQGGQTAVPLSTFVLLPSTDGAQLALAANAAYPAPFTSLASYVVNYRAGYGEAAADVPETIKLAIKQLVAHWFEHRGEAALVPARSGNTHFAITSVPLVIMALLDAYKVRSIGAA